MATKAIEVPQKVTDDVGPTCLADIAKGATADGDCATDAHTPPAWLDIDRCNAGRQVFEDNVFNFIINFHFSLVLGMCVKPFIQALIFTGQSSTPSDAIARYMRTYKFLAAWHLGDIFDDSDDPNGGMSAFTAVASVRTFHKSVRSQMSAKLPAAVYMNQYDMALVQTGFMGAMVLVPKGSGMNLTQQQMDDYVYFWRCVAHQLGVSDQYNLCGRGNPTATSITWEVVRQVVMPSEDTVPEPDYDTLINAYLDGMQGNGLLGIKPFTLNAMLAYSYGMLGETFTRKLTLGDRVRVVIYKLFVAILLYLPGVASIANKGALCATKAMLKNWNLAQCQGQGICPVAGATKSPEEMALHSLKGKECPGAQKESRWTRFSRNAVIFSSAAAAILLALFWVTLAVGGVVYATHLALQHAY